MNETITRYVSEVLPNAKLEAKGHCMLLVGGSARSAKFGAVVAIGLSV